MKKEEFMEQMLRQVDGLSVDNDFWQEIEKNPKLFNDLYCLQSDVDIMNAMTDDDFVPKVFYENKKNFLCIEKINSSSIIDFRYKVESIFNFESIDIPIARSQQQSELKNIYLCKDIEVSIFDKKICLKVKKINKSLEVKHNSKTIVKSSNLDHFDIELEYGSYQIIVDNYSVDVVLK